MSKRCVFHSVRRIATLAFCMGGVLLYGSTASAFDVLGTGTDSLIGNDLTDLGDDGDPEFDEGYDAIFDSSDEPGFGGENSRSTYSTIVLARATISGAAALVAAFLKMNRSGYRHSCPFRIS